MVWTHTSPLSLRLSSTLSLSFYNLLPRRIVGMADALYPSVDLKTDAMDLARRLSSLQHFLPAAHQLLSCEHLSPDDVDRYARKVE